MIIGGGASTELVDRFCYGLGDNAVIVKRSWQCGCGCDG